MPSGYSTIERRMLPGIAILLGAIGLVFIYSASSYAADLEYGDAFFYVKKQAIALAFGIVTMFGASMIPPGAIKKFRYVILILSLVLLGLVFIPGLGVESYGATRWLNLGITTIQPSEISKFGLMLFLSSYMTDRQPVSIKNMIVPILSGGAICLLIMAEPNMSVTVCVGACLLSVLFVAGSKKRWFFLLIVLVLIAIPVLILAEPYRIKRIIAFIDPWENPLGEGYQLIQSYYAIGHGGLFGVGLFASRQKYLFLPFSESDFIFSVVVEETGLVGGAVLLLIFLAFVVCGFRIAMNASTRFESLTAFSVTIVVAMQTVLNVAVVTGSIPPTGLPLPFISAGGTSLVSFFFATGLLYGVAKRSDRSLLRKKPVRLFGLRASRRNQKAIPTIV
ncbi:MAG: putative lipid II flippase FtsW [Clostridia bacterium]|nr:putative lipid II flippase FtsW [Clostridia bacterium]